MKSYFCPLRGNWGVDFCSIHRCHPIEIQHKCPKKIAKFEVWQINSFEESFTSSPMTPMSLPRAEEIAIFSQNSGLSSFKCLLRIYFDSFTWSCDELKTEWMMQRIRVDPTTHFYIFAKSRIIFLLVVQNRYHKIFWGEMNLKIFKWSVKISTFSSFCVQKLP